MTPTLISVLLPLFANAEEAKPSLEWHLFGDAYYSYNFNQPAPATGPTGTSVTTAAIPNGQNTYRYYDVYHNQITLSLVELSMLAKYGETSFLTDFDFGSFADLNALSTTSGRSVDEVSKHSQQHSMGPIFKLGPLSTTIQLLGLFYSHSKTHFDQR